jgi:hypothetical protein
VLFASQIGGEILFGGAEGLHVETGLAGLGERIVQEGGDFLEPHSGEELLSGLHILGGDERDGRSRVAGALPGKKVGDLERLPYLLPVVARPPLDIALVPLAVEPVVVLEEGCAGAECDNEPAPAAGVPDGIGCEKASPGKLVEVLPKLLPGDLGLVFEDGQSAEPFGADIVISLLEREACAAAPVMQIGEVEEQTHVERLADRAETRH